MRKYENVKTLPPKNDWRGKINTRRKIFGIAKNLKIVHIGNDVWRFGKARKIKGKGLHSVIYGPNSQEYHTWNDDARNLAREYWNEYEDVYGRLDDIELSQRNNFQHDKVKIYILTSILDDRKNWCFDLTNIPKIGKLKVIYDNDTIKNIDFNGEFEKIEINKYFREIDGTRSKNPYRKKKVKPVGYRKMEK